MASRRESTLLGPVDMNSLLLLLVIGAVVAVVLAAVIGFLSLRHTGLYFSLLTLAFGQLIFAIVQSHNTELGGSDGLPVRPSPEGEVLLFGTSLGDSYSFVLYYLTAIIVVIGLYVMYRIANSPFGSALDAIGQDRTRAQFIGLPVKRYVWGAFIISGLYAGIAGALFAMLLKHINPEQTLHFLVSGDILLMAILGGFNTLVGPLVGGIVFEFLLFWGEDFAGTLDSLTAGLVLLLLVFGFPQGIVGSLKEGSALRRSFSDFVEDPSVVGDWVRKASESISAGVKRSSRNLRVLLFGVK